MNSHRAQILIVDDDKLNRSLLMAMFEGSGHQMMQASSGSEAIALATVQIPDMVLLDVMMPGLDGFETTRRLKVLAGGLFLPIVLITARKEREAKLLGLASGADEFLSQPIDKTELLLRVSNLLRLREKEVLLAHQNTNYAELHRFKEEFSQLLTHDLRNPLAAVLLNLDFATNGDTPVDAEVRESLEQAGIGTQRALRIIDSLLDVTRIESGRLELRRRPTDIPHLLHSVVNQRTMLTRARDIKVECDASSHQSFDIDSDLILRVVENLFDNSVRHTPSGGRIGLSSTVNDQGTCIRVGNTGPSIPHEFRRVIFEKYGQGAKVGRANLGLGLYFCRLAAEAHGGRIWVEDTPEFPTVFVLQLPLAQA